MGAVAARSDSVAMLIVGELDNTPAALFLRIPAVVNSENI